MRILPSVHSSVMWSVPNEFWAVRYLDSSLGSSKCGAASAMSW